MRHHRQRRNEEGAASVASGRGACGCAVLWGVVGTSQRVRRVAALYSDLCVPLKNSVPIAKSIAKMDRYKFNEQSISFRTGVSRKKLASLPIIPHIWLEYLISGNHQLRNSSKQSEAKTQREVASASHVLKASA